MSGFFLIRCRARHDSCDGRLLRNVGQSSEISMNVRSKQTNNKKQQQKSPKTKTTQNTKPNNHPKTRSTAVKRCNVRRTDCRLSKPLSCVLLRQKALYSRTPRLTYAFGLTYTLPLPPSFLQKMMMNCWMQHRTRACLHRS